MNGGAGDFVVTWDSYDLASYSRVDSYFQRYNNAGVAQGSLTQSDVGATAGYRFDSTVAALSGGGFIVTWKSDQGDYDLNGIFGRRFDSTGAAVDASDIEINQYRRGEQVTPSVTGLLTNDLFATVWTDLTSDTTSAGIEARVLGMPNAAPTLGGTFTTAGVVNDNATTTPFSGVTYADADGTSYSVTITYTAANGSLSGTGLSGTAGSYTVSGADAATVQANLQALVFTPTANQVALASTVATTFTLTPNDGSNGTPNATTVVTATSVNDAPTLGGAMASQAVNDNATVSPFSSFTVADPDIGASITASIALDAAAKGGFTNASLISSGFSSADGGLTYTHAAATPAAMQAAIRALVFQPAINRVAPSSTETTTFTVSVNDGIAPAVTNSTTTVVSTSVNDAPAFSGGTSSLTVAHDSVTSLTPNLHVNDIDLSQTETWSQSVAPSHGTLSFVSAAAASGSTDITPGGTITYTPSAGYVGSDSFTVQVSDGTATATRAFTVTVAAPTIAGATYDVSTGIMTVTGTNLAMGDTIAVNALTLTGEGGATYTLTSANVTATSATSFAVTLNATDQAAVSQILNKTGTTSTSGSTFNLAAADDWNTNVTIGDTSDNANALSVSNVAAPTLVSATYDYGTNVLTVTGSGFLSKSGAATTLTLPA